MDYQLGKKPPQAPGGSLEDIFTSPLFLMGANVLGADNVGSGLAQGVQQAGRFSAQKQNRADRMADREYSREMDQKRLGLSQQRFAFDKQRATQGDELRSMQIDDLRMKRAAGPAQLVRGNADNWNRFLQADPKLAASIPDQFRGDPILGADWVIAKARGYQEPAAVNKNGPEYRASMANQYGLAPGSDAYRRYVLTGQLSDKGVSGGDDTDLAQNVAAGIETLARVPGDFDQSTFENAVGPYQGAEDGGLVGGISRAIGSAIEGVTNYGGKGYTSEVRNRIAGDTEALAAAIKPLIRKPGEGPWTDSDQKRLVAVVGNLSQARNAEEYRRALEGVRQRVMNNFAIPLPEISGAPLKIQGRAPQGQSPYSTMSNEELLRSIGAGQ